MPAKRKPKIAPTPRLVLCMIVRDEVAVLARAVASAVPHVHAVVIVDTGSTDGTVLLARELLKSSDLPGEVAEMVWTDFADARNSALGLAGRYGTHALILDADDTLEVTNLAITPDLSADAYDVEVVHGAIVHRRPHIVRIGIGARWRGVVHEYLELPDHFVRADAPWRIVIGSGGVRSRDPFKYLLDADDINIALDVEQDQGLRNRYCFYLAQSYRDARHAGAAVYWYSVVVEALGWAEERYIAALNLGRITGLRKWFHTATDINPRRAEAWRELGYPDIADACTLDPSWLFVETAAYRSPT